MEATELLAGEQVRAAVPVQAIARGGRSRARARDVLVFTRVSNVLAYIQVVITIHMFSSLNETGKLAKRNAVTGMKWAMR